MSLTTQRSTVASSAFNTPLKLAAALGLSQVELIIRNTSDAGTEFASSSGNNARGSRWDNKDPHSETGLAQLI